MGPYNHSYLQVRGKRYARCLAAGDLRIPCNCKLWWAYLFDHMLCNKAFKQQDCTPSSKGVTMPVYEQLSMLFKQHTFASFPFLANSIQYFYFEFLDSSSRYPSLRLPPMSAALTAILNEYFWKIWYHLSKTFNTLRVNTCSPWQHLVIHLSVMLNVIIVSTVTSETVISLILLSNPATGSLRSLPWL